MIDTIRATDAGMKDMNVTVEINGKDIIVSTPYEKIFIPQKEFEKLWAAYQKAEVKVEVKVEEPPVEKWARKEKRND
jgi:hypothetical protein